MNLEELEDALETYVTENAWAIIATLIVIAGIYLTFRTYFIHVKGMKTGAKLLFSSGGDEKNVSPFESFCVAIGSHLGVGLVMGLGTAILLGGPGAVFWIWVMAIFGSVLNLMEATLAQMFKEKRKDGMYYGGLPLVIEKGLGKPTFAKFFLILSIAAVFSFTWVQTGSISGFFNNNFVPDSIDGTVFSIIVAAVITIAVAVILMLDLKKEAKMSSKVVPLVAVGWIAICIFVILAHFDTIIPSIQRILNSAFNYSGSIAGATIGFTIMWGFRRGEYTLNCGSGLDAISAGSVDCKHPASQGLIQSFNALIISPLLVTITALTILTLGDYTAFGGQVDDSKWYLLEALKSNIGDFAVPVFFIVVVALGFGFIISACIIISTDLEMFHASDKTKKIVFVLFLISVFLSCIVPMTLVWNLGDLIFGLSTAVGVVVILLLWKRTVPVIKDYMEKRKTESTPVFVPEDIPDFDSDGMNCWKK